MRAGSPRPTSVTFLAVLSITLGALSIITGLAGVGLSVDPVAAYSILAANILVGLGTVIIVFGLLEIVYAVGFLGGKGWSWTLGIVVAGVSLISSIAVFALPFIVGSGLTASAGSTDTIAFAVLIITAQIAIVPIITSAVTVFGLTRRRVKVFFGKAAPPQAEPI